jgi:hypothetical protein
MRKILNKVQHYPYRIEVYGKNWETPYLDRKRRVYK